MKPPCRSGASRDRDITTAKKAREANGQPAVAARAAPTREFAGIAVSVCGRNMRGATVRFGKPAFSNPAYP
ncbi:hypothetical protein RDV84_22240 [Lysobacter yananisis]|uniref:Uncharacterized protein n=1 Tax=Lysobacter yananisis TaxID=1003114 RepID=A0ABY9P8F2_9GAMM|nr:hypothetical protein [Lysobacter yananisis]WMT02653.1 hypothetical protein RDV84_22240 [Lysobacter yananisis]